MFLLSNRDNDLIQMPFVVGARTIAPDAICEMWTKLIDPQPDRLRADNHTALGQQVFDVGRAHCEAMVSPNSVRDDFPREPKALQAQHTGWDFHDVEIARSCRLNNLAMPCRAFTTGSGTGFRRHCQHSSKACGTIPISRSRWNNILLHSLSELKEL